MNRSRSFARFAETEAVSDDLKRKSVVGALTTGAGGALDLVLRLGSTLILARLLVPEDFGLVVMVTAITAIAEYFTNLGLSTATVQSPRITHEQCSNLFWINAAAGAAFAVLLVLFSPAIAAFYGDPRLRAIAVVLSLNFIFIGAGVQHEALLRRQMKLPRLAASHLVATLLSVSVAIGLAWSGFGYWALVLKEVVQAFLVAAGSWFLCPWLPGLPSRDTPMRRLLTFGRDMTLTQLLLAVSAQLDTLLIGRFVNAVTLGLYRQAYNLIMTPVERLRAPIYSVSQPGLSILQAEPDRYRRYYQRILFVVTLVTVPLGVFTFLYAHEIVLVALGEKWLGSIVFLRIFGVAAVVLPALGTTGTVMITCGRSGRFFIVALINNLTMVICMVVGIGFGAVGIAVARVATSIVIMPWSLPYSFSGTPVSVGDFLRSISRPCIASAIMGVSLWAFRRVAPLESEVLALLGGAAAAGLVYFLAFLLIPGGRNQVQSLAAELLGVIRNRSSVRVKADEDTM